MGWEVLAFFAVAVIILAPIMVLVLQFSVLGRQRKLTDQLERWLPELRRHLVESRRLLEDLARVAPAATTSQPTLARHRRARRNPRFSPRSRRASQRPLASLSPEEPEAAELIHLGF